jgi:hypothetical protein
MQLTCDSPDLTLQTEMSDMVGTADDFFGRVSFRIAARLDRKRLGQSPMRSSCGRSEVFSMSRLEGSRWRLRRAWEMRRAMEFEWGFLRLLFGAKRECRHFHGCGEEMQIPPHTWRIISRAASAAPAATFLPVTRESRTPQISILWRNIAEDIVVIFSLRGLCCFRNNEILVQSVRVRTMTDKRCQWFFAAVICMFPVLRGSCLAQRLTGKWEGTYSESRRVIVFSITFDSETSGTLQILGKQIPITAKTVEGGVEIRTEDDDPTVFSGKEQGSVIAGELRYRATTLHFRMEREPQLAHPKNRDEAWRQDLDYAQRKLLRLETSFTPASRQRFLESIENLNASVATVDDAHLIVAFARTLAAIGNAHTRLYLLRNRTDLRRLPIRVWWFRDRLYIIRTAPEQSRLLGCEVVRIAGVPALRAKQIVAGLYAGSNGWRDYMSTYTLTSPEILYGSNVAPSMESIRWDLNCQGETLSADLKPLPLERSTMPVESWWDLAPGAPLTLQGGKGMTFAVMPVYLRDPDHPYWFEFLPDVGALYFQYNRAAPDEQHPLAKFEEELMRAMTAHPSAALIVDLRFNTGGDGNVARQTMSNIQNACAFRKVYVITGRTTFSAGLFHAVQWKHWGKAIFVGEEPGDGLEFFAEGGNILLPNSRLTVHFANARHCYSAASQTPSTDCFNELRVEPLTIALPASNSFEQYRSGRDAALESIVADLKKAVSH